MAKPRRVSAHDIHRIAKERLKFEKLRPGQEQTIRLILDGHDTLSIMPTGAGKSAVYQIAALLTEGYALVISPLLALQKDQRESIEERGLGKAAVVNSTQHAAERRAAFTSLADGSLKFLFCAPEQLSNDEAREHLLAHKPALIVVDEAHCISEWGHDFRPEYARLGDTIQALGGPTILALTATASPNVREEIVKRLGMRDPRTVVWGFERPNIWMGVESCPDEEAKNRVLLWRLGEMQKPGIVYVATHAHAEEVCRLLKDAKIQADCYHGGMNKTDRDSVQDAFMTDKRDVVVATNAFGMGVDKPDVRTVIHYDIPEAIDEYYQEIGRAGRDGRPSRALLLYRPQDVGLRRAQAAPPKLTEEVVLKVEEAIEEQRGGIEVKELKEELKQEAELPAGKTAAAVARLEEVGAVERLPDGEIKPVQGIDVEQVAETAVKDQEAYRQYRLGRVELMKDYAESRDCRRRYILNYFGEEREERCDCCDNCDLGLSDKAAKREAATEKHPFAIKSRIVHKKFGEGVVMRYEGDKIDVLFDEAGPKQIVLQFAIEHELIAPLS